MLQIKERLYNCGLVDYHLLIHIPRTNNVNGDLVNF